MNNQKDEHQKFDKSKKPQYIKPKVVATYRSPELEKEFANVYGTSGGGGSVDLHYKMDMIIKLLLEQKGYNSFKVCGDSMLPYIKEGDISQIALCQEFKLGDIVIYGKNSKLLIHRIVGIRQIEGKIRFLLKGDNRKTFDPYWIEKKQIIGRVHLVYRKTKCIYNRDSLWYRLTGLLITFYSYLIGYFISRFGSRNIISRGMRVFRNWIIKTS